MEKYLSLLIEQFKQANNIISKEAALSVLIKTVATAKDEAVCPEGNEYVIGLDIKSSFLSSS